MQGRNVMKKEGGAASHVLASWHSHRGYGMTACTSLESRLSIPLVSTEAVT
jgi:hypothetical protein